MTMFEYEVIKQHSTHSFDNYQVSVVEMSDRQGALHKGIAVSPPLEAFNFEVSKVTGSLEQLLAIDSQQALILCDFLKEVLDGTIPNKKEIKTSGPTLRIYITKYIEKWHGGGGYKGQIKIGRFRPQNMFSSVTISRNSIKSFRDSLKSLYDGSNGE